MKFKSYKLDVLPINGMIIMNGYLFQIQNYIF